MFGNVICRVCLPWGLREGVLWRILFPIASRLAKAQEQFWEICLGGGGDQLSPMLREACPKGRQLPPIFWRRICRACRLRRQARKGGQSMEDYRKTVQKDTKKVPKWYPGGTEEPPGSSSETRTCFSQKNLKLLGALFEAWSDHLGHLFLRFFRVPSRNDFWGIVEPK